VRVLFALLMPVFGVLALADPAAANSGRLIHAAGTFSVTYDFASLQVEPQGQQCILRVQETVTFTGTLAGASATVEPAEAVFFATCDEVLANPEPFRDEFRDVEYYIGDDGTEATLTAVGARADGVYRGILIVQGDLQGLLHQVGTSAGGTYEGVLVQH
jgi:hypothetical protein